MVYRITFRKRAAKEYIKAIAWYKERSLRASENFRKAVEEGLNKIESDPFYFRNSYKHFFETKLPKYPYGIVYFIDEESRLVVITTIFHHKRHPKRKYPNK